MRAIGRAVETALLLALATSAAAGGHSEHPNVVLVMADDLGYSDIGAYGSEVRTPAIDRLADGGLRFTQLYNMAKCETTRSSLLTGLFAAKRHAANARSLPGLLRDAGYHTAMVGKEHLSGWAQSRSARGTPFTAPSSTRRSITTIGRGRASERTRRTPSPSRWRSSPR